MSKKVRAAVVEGKERMAIREFDRPMIKEDDALLKVEMAGVCGTDPGVYSDKIKFTDFPIILGHEILGWIDEIGDVAAERWKIKRGDRVVVESMIRCGYCPKCVSGDYRFCEKHLAYGTWVSSSVPPHLWGAYAEYLYLPPDKGTPQYESSSANRLSNKMWLRQPQVRRLWDRLDNGHVCALSLIR